MRDARLDELSFLTRLERDGHLTVPQRVPGQPDGSDVKVAMHLLALGILNDATSVAWPLASPVVRSSTNFALPGRTNEYQWKIEEDQWKAIARLHAGEEVRVAGTHASSVRRAELEQSFLRGRLRDPSGILLDGRYADRDLRIALLSATPSTPVTVTLLDMNGLKTLNDTLGHSAGDEAIRAFFEVIADVTYEKGDAHRIGGDEVLITLPNMSSDAAARLVRLILRGVAERRIREQPHQRLSAVAGLTTATSPGQAPKEVRDRADKVQYLAKEHSKSRTGERFCAMAVDGVEQVEAVEPEAVAIPAT